MDILSILLIIVITVLSSFSVIIGIQVYRLLKEFRLTVVKINKILDDLGVVSGSVIQPVAGLSGFLAGIKTVGEIFKFFKGKKEEK